MAQTAAHLVDHVIPPVPVRQWVISVLKRLRCFLADRPNAVAALTRVFIEDIERLLCTAAGSTRDGDRPSAARPRLGAVSFLHRFGSAIKSRPMTKANVGKPRDAATRGHTDDGSATGRCCDATHATQKPRSHDTSRIAWAKLMARVGEEFPLECPACGGDIRLIAFITEPGPIRKILTHLAEPLEQPPVSPARGPPNDWGELVQIHDDRDVFQASPDELPAIDIHSL